MYALVTGASSGIGKALSRELAKIGYDLILVARRTERLLALKQELKKEFATTCVILEYDLSNPDNCIALFKDCKSYPIRVVINNAGFGKTGDYSTIRLEDELAMINTNITAVHILTKLFANHMLEGLILNVASIAAFYPIPVMSAYGASKSYVLQYSRAVNYELKKAGKPVKICVLCPGPVDTEFNQVAGASFSLTSMSPEQCAKIAIAGMRKGKEVIVPGITTKIMSVLSHISPAVISLPVEYKIQTKKLKSFH